MLPTLARFVAIVHLLALGTSAFVVAQEKKGTPANLMPGPGVADPAGKVGFFPNTTGGIDALDLASGKLLWSSKDANRPLLATQDRLFAQKNVSGKPNQFRVVVLDSSKEGKRVLESEPIALPDWVSISVALGRTYRSSTRLGGDDLFVSWEARAFYAGGARPSPEVEKAARKEATGVVRIDLATGKLEMLKADAGLFALTNDVVTAKAGALTLSLKDGPAKNAKNPFQRMHMLQAVSAAKEVVWQHEIAAPVFLPPPP